MRQNNYRKYASMLIAMNCFLSLCYITSNTEEVTNYIKDVAKYFTKQEQEHGSSQRTIEKELLEKEIEVYTEDEYTMLERIVEAEARGEDMIGKILVCNVVLNRVSSTQFPNSIHGVIFHQVNGRYQFSPVSNGVYYSVSISDSTKEAVERAMDGEDYSEGALYFMARQYANTDDVTWFDRKLTLLFQHGGHEFFR
ncbi:MAG: cell wall hydrolase [Eubacteriales bacterium]